MQIKNFALIFLGGLSFITGLAHYLGSFMGFGRAVSALYLNHAAVDAMQNIKATDAFVPHFMRNTGLMLCIIGGINLSGILERSRNQFII